MLKRITGISLAVFAFFLPLVFSSITAEYYEFNKLVFFILSASWFFTLFILRAVIDKKLSFPAGKSSFFFLVFTLSAIVSFLFASPNKAVALSTPMSVSTIVAAYIIYITASGCIERKMRQIVLGAFLSSSVIIGIYAILMYLGIIPVNVFTPAGTLLTSFIFLVLALIYSGIYLATKIISRSSFEELKKTVSKHSFSFAFHTIILAVTFLSACFMGIRLLTDQQPIILPFSIGWSILMDTYKNFKVMLLGIGMSNFITAFSVFRPIMINSTKYWNILFSSNSSFFLNFAVEAGITGAISFLLLLISSLRKTLDFETLFIPKNKELNHAEKAQDSFARRGANEDQFAAIFTLVVLFIFLLILPVGISIFGIFTVLLILSEYKKERFSIDLRVLKNGSIGFLFLIVIPIAIIYSTFKVYLAEVSFKKSMDALMENRGKDVYDRQLEAINLGQSIDRYRVAFSQTNIAIADNLAQNKEISEEEKKNIPLLIQQSIDQARIAVTLYRTNPKNWENLARIYANLVNFADDAEEWAVKTYEQLIALDPVNPNNRIGLGRVYASKNKWDLAQYMFNQAVSLKPDLALARYNLAIALREQEKYEQSYHELNTTLTLIPQDSEDAKKLREEIEAMKKFLPDNFEKDTPENLNPEQTTQQELPLIRPDEETTSSFSNLPTPFPTLNAPEPPITDNP